VRMLSFSIADGAMPGPEGRGYVLRRILRRAARFGRNLGMREPFIWRIVPTLAETMGAAFPELREKRSIIERIIRAEEESFNATLDRGLEIFEDIVDTTHLRQESTITGEDVFKLYDTFGFPIDLTNLLAEERGLAIDTAGFETLLARQKERSRAVTRSKLVVPTAAAQQALQFDTLDGEPQGEFVGYDTMYTEATVTGLARNEGLLYILLDRSPFYVESGGQVSDTGVLTWKGVRAELRGLLKNEDGIVHVVDAQEGFSPSPGELLSARVDERARRDTMRNHTATHLLHAALRETLGTHVQQAGSLVEPERLRFDFSHFEKPSQEQLAEIERIVNERIFEALPVNRHRDLPFEQAKTMGALMFFGDKYGDRVNVLEIPGCSMEFCGGTHVRNTAEIGLMKIVSEGSIASGTRRIEAVTGRGISEYIARLHREAAGLREREAELLEQLRRFEKEAAKAAVEHGAAGLDTLLRNAEEFSGGRLVVARVQAADAEQLKALGDVLREKLRSGIGLLAADIDGKVQLVCVVTDDFVAKGIKAGAVVGPIAKKLGGGGGGRPHMATAGAKDVAALDAVLAEAPSIIRELAQA
jgi:alanyl-tRNA synthetase